MARRDQVLRGVWTPLVLVALLVGLLGLLPLRGVAEGPHRAALVVAFGEGQVQARCVEFAEAQVSGADLLRRSGLAVVLNETQGLGAAVCAIEGVGCQFPAEDCFCQCRGAACRYWTYWRLEGGKWVYSGVGASSRLLSDGDADAWVWGDGKKPPPPLTFADVCPGAGVLSPHPATPTPEPASPPVPTATPARAASATPTPSRPAPPMPAPTGVPEPTSTQPAPATETATPTATSSPAPTAPPTGTPMPTPTPPAAAPAPDAPEWGQYLAFAGMAVALAGALALARRKRG